MSLTFPARAKILDFNKTYTFRSVPQLFLRKVHPGKQAKGVWFFPGRVFFCVSLSNHNRGAVLTLTRRKSIKQAQPSLYHIIIHLTCPKCLHPTGSARSHPLALLSLARHSKIGLHIYPSPPTRMGHWLESTGAIIREEQPG